MANQVVNLFKRVKTSKGLRYCPVVYDKRFQLVPDMVLVDGEQERHPEDLLHQLV